MSSEEKTRFDTALQQGNSALVLELLKAGTVDVNAILSSTQHRPLHRAAAKGNDKESDLMVQALLDKGADPDLRTIQGETPLYDAAKVGNKDTAGLIIDALKKKYQGHPQKLLDALRAPTNGKTPFQVASDKLASEIALRIKQEVSHCLVALGDKEHFDTALKEGNTALVDKFLHAGTVDVNVALSTQQHRPLHRAAAKGNTNDSDLMVKALLDKGADPDLRTTQGETALYDAVSVGNNETAILIIDALKKKYQGHPQALLDALRAPTNGKTPFQVADGKLASNTALRIHQEVSKCLVALGDKEHFDAALKEGNTALVDKFLHAGTVDVNVILSSDLHRPLHRAAAKGNGSDSDQMVKALLDKGADPDLRTVHGKTALYDAANVGNNDTGCLIVEALKKKYQGHPQALLDALQAPTNGKTPFQVATNKQVTNLSNVIQREVSSCLVALGDHEHFDTALKEGNTALVDKFLQAGTVDVNVILSALRHRPLHRAASKGNGSDSDQMVKALLDHGADPDLRTIHGETALYDAASAGNNDTGCLIVDALKNKYQGQPQKLLEALNAPTNGKTPLEVAQEKWRNLLATKIQSEINQITGNGTNQPYVTALLATAAIYTPIPKVAPVVPRSNTPSPIKLDRTLTAAKLQQINSGGKSNLETLCEQGKLGDVFTDDIWIGRREEMDQVWEQVPEKFRNQVNIEVVRGQLSQATVRDRFKLNQAEWEQGF